MWFPLCEPKVCLNWSPPWPSWQFTNTKRDDIDWTPVSEGGTYDVYKSFGININACGGVRYRNYCDVTCNAGYWGKTYKSAQSIKGPVGGRQQIDV